MINDRAQALSHQQWAFIYPGEKAFLALRLSIAFRRDNLLGKSLVSAFEQIIEEKYPMFVEPLAAKQLNRVSAMSKDQRGQISHGCTNLRYTTGIFHSCLVEH